MWFLQCCRILLSHEVSPSERDVDGFTAADLAEYNGHYECARYLRSVMTDVRITFLLLAMKSFGRAYIFQLKYCVGYLKKTHQNMHFCFLTWIVRNVILQLNGRPDYPYKRLMILTLFRHTNISNVWKWAAWWRSSCPGSIQSLDYLASLISH